MITVIRESPEITPSVQCGQMRMGEEGRVVLIIIDKRIIGVGIGAKREETLRVLLLKKGANDGGTVFHTIPAEYTEEEIEIYYPTIIGGSIELGGRF